VLAGANYPRACLSYFRKGFPALPFCHISLKGQKPLPKAYPQELGTLGDHLRKKRPDLRLFRKQVALILGVEEATIWNWENNRSSPNLRYIPKIVEFSGYVPFDGEPKTLGEKIIHCHHLSGMTQKELAHRLGIDPSTLARWERNECKPLRKHLEKLTTFFASLPSGLRPYGSLG
jgi:transcriptional regulator with XRE-family HTH domain